MYIVLSITGKHKAEGPISNKITIFLSQLTSYSVLIGINPKYYIKRSAHARRIKSSTRTATNLLTRDR